MIPPTPEESQEHLEKVKNWVGSGRKGDKPVLETKYKKPSELFKENIAMAIQAAHPTANVQSLRRTKSIIGQLELAIKEKNGIVNLAEDDYRYVKSAINKADKWHNLPEVADLIIEIADKVDLAIETEV